MTDTTTAREQPATATDALLECDIVMAGGVTSGIIYPGAVAVISQRYAFRSIGGTSVGAIAASATAAAEYGRLTGRNPRSFERLAELSKTLSDTAGDGHSRLFHLFTPEPATKPLLALVTPLFGGGGIFKQLTGILRTTLKAWQIALAVAFISVLLLWTLYALIYQGHSYTTASGIAASLIGIVAALALLAVVWVIALVGMLIYRWLPAWQNNGYGICTGGSQFGPAAKPDQPPFDGLSLWMHKIVQEAAGRTANDDPMTFGDLWGAASSDPQRQTDPYKPRAIDLSMVTSDISRNRTVQLPFMETPSPVYVDRHVLARYLPDSVVAWMAAHPGENDDRFELKPGVFRLPLPHDLPLGFAARLSLSFPVLLSAFPLLTPDFSAQKTAAGKIPLRNLWLSDGGLTSNFPVHFFDSPVPSRPTFCLNLIDYDASTADGAAADPSAEQATERPKDSGSAAAGKPISQPRSELRKTSARPERSPARDPLPNDDVWGFISMADGNRIPPPPFTAFDAPGAGLLPFFKALLNTARFWSDNQMLIAPGVRDRVVNIGLLDTEGGLNLDMPAKTIDGLNFRGRAAGMLISARYDPAALIDPETGQPNHEIFANHRWVRFRNFMAAFEDMSRRFVLSRRASDKAAAARNESQLAQMIAGTAPEKLGYPAPVSARDYYRTTTQGFEDFATGMAKATEADAHATFDAPRAFSEKGATNPPGAAPRPKMRFRLRPLGDNDPSAESAPLPKNP